MGVASRSPAAAGGSDSARLAPAAAVDAGMVAWLLVLPCALVSVAAIVVLGPPLGRLISPAHSSFPFWHHLAFFIRPEPTEQSRFLISLGAPVLLALATVAAVRRVRREQWAPRRLVAPLVALAQVATVAFVLVCLVVQERFHYEPQYGFEPGVFFKHVYFTPRTLVVAVVLAAALVAAVRSARVRERFGAWARESRSRRIVAVVVAAAATAIWMVHAINTDTSIAWAFSPIIDNLMFTLDETFAVLNGRTPLVDYTAQYGSLWPYVVALPMLAFGKTLLVFTIAMSTLTVLALLAILDVLRRVTRSTRIALLLYLPFLATSLFTARGSYANRLTPGDYFGLFPMRTAGPYILALITARHLERARPRMWIVSIVAGIAMLNNTDYSLAALGGTVAAILWTADERSPRFVLRLAGNLLVGVLAAFALVSALTLARAGALPQPGRLFHIAEKFTRGGFGMIPLPTVVGLDLVIYATYIAAIGVATVRGLNRAPNRVLTGMLVWSGIFGLGTASYYIGRSHPDSLVACFSAWALSLALLTVVVVERLAKQPSARPNLAQFAVLVGLGVMVCSLALTPTPWSQLARIDTPGEVPNGIPATPFLPDPATRNFYASAPYGSRFYVKRGMPVAILTTIGNRVADAFGVVNVSPYPGIWAINTQEELQETVEALRKAGGNTLLMSAIDIDDQIYDVLDRWGFELLTTSGLKRLRDVRRDERVSVPWIAAPVIKWVDVRNLHPRFLREGRGAPVPAT